MSDRSARGIPISRAILLPPGPLENELRPALETIDGVHGDGDLDSIWVEPDPTIEEESVYEYIQPLGIPLRIAMRPRTRHPRLLLVHEVGHFLDHQGLGMAGVFSSLAHPRLAPWRDLVTESRAYRELSEIELDRLTPTSRRFLEYLLSYDELWARSYEQFVTLQSRDVVLLAQLGAARRPPHWPSRLPRLWTEDEFEPIGRAMDDIFRSLRWKT